MIWACLPVSCLLDLHGYVWLDIFCLIYYPCFKFQVQACVKMITWCFLFLIINLNVLLNSADLLRVSSCAVLWYVSDACLMGGRCQEVMCICYGHMTGQHGHMITWRLIPEAVLISCLIYPYPLWLASPSLSLTLKLFLQTMPWLIAVWQVLLLNSWPTS